MHHSHRFLLLLIAFIAPSTHASIVARQDTSSSTSSLSTAATSATSATVPSTTSATDLTSTTALASTTSSISTTSAKPFVSVGSGGSLLTITPTGTSTLSPIATGLTNSTSNSTEPSAPACSSQNYALNGAAAPFCLPTNGSVWIQDTSYPVTWDPNFWPDYTGNIVLALLYTGADGSGVISQNNNISNQRGFFNIDVDASWLNGKNVVAARLLIAPNDPTSTNGGAHFGPTVSLQDSETPFDSSPPKVKNLAVIIAVPIAAVVVLILVCGVCCLMRKHRKLPEGLLVPRNGGRKSRGYAEGRSRRKRTGIEKTTDEFELGTVSGYRDEPADVYSDVPEHTTRRD